MRARYAATPLAVMLTGWAMSGELWHLAMLGRLDPAILVAASAGVFVVSCAAFTMLLEALRA